MPNDKMTIGIVMPLGVQVGGAEALLGHLLRTCTGQFRYVCAFLQEGPLVDEVRGLGYETVVIPASRLSDLRDYGSTVRALRSWLQVQEVQIAISWMAKGQMYLGIAAAGLPLKVVWFQHSVPGWGSTLDRLVTMLPASAVLCCSETSKHYQDRLFPTRQSFVCYPGVLMPSENGPSKREARRQLGLPEEGQIVGMVARLERWKGAHVLVDAAQYMLRKDPKPTLFVVGGPHSLAPKYAEDLARTVQEKGYGSHFIMAGQRSTAETLLWQTAADVIVHPVIGVEPFGMAVVEAMAQGKLVVTSARGGPAEVIRDGFNGMLIASGDPQLLASTLLDLLDHPEERRAMEKEAYIRGRTFSIAAFVSRFESLMMTIAELNPSQRPA